MKPAPTRPIGWAASLRNSVPLRYFDLGLICLGIFVLQVGVGAIVPIRAIYAREHGATMAELGLMASSFLLGSFLFQLPGGWASDRWGRKPLLVAGMAIAGVLSFMFLLSDHPWYFIVLRFIEGAAGGAIAPASNAYVIDAVPPNDRPAAFGWLGSATSAGFMVGPAVGGILGDLLGYSAPFIFGGVTTLLVSAFLALRLSNLRPGTARLDATGQVVEEEQNKRQVPGSLFVPALLGAVVLAAGSGFGDGLFISLWTIWLNDLHASSSFIGFTFITFSLPLMLFMPWAARLASRYRLSLLITIPAVAINVIYASYAFAENLPLIAFLGLVEGTLLAIIIPARSAYIANLSPTNARGRIQGIISTTTTASGFLSSIGMMLLYEQNKAFPFLTMAAVQSVLALSGGLIVWSIEQRSARIVAHARAAQESDTEQLEVAGMR